VPFPAGAAAAAGGREVPVTPAAAERAAAERAAGMNRGVTKDTAGAVAVLTASVERVL